MIENEHDSVFTGKFDERVRINRKEIEGFEWIDVKKLKKEINENPNNYTPWFKLALNKLF